MKYFRLYNDLPLPSLPRQSITPSSPPPLLPLPLGRCILQSGEEHSLCFYSNWLRWAEPCQCPHHLLLSRVQGKGGSVQSEGFGDRKIGRKENAALPRPGKVAVILVQAEQATPGGGIGTRWKGYVTVGVSLERTNHHFIWLDGHVWKRDSPGREQSLSVALSSEGRWKRSREFIRLKRSIYEDANSRT